MQLSDVHHFRLLIPEPFDFSLTVAKPSGWYWSTPGEVFQDGVLWSGLYVHDKPIGLRMSAIQNEVSITVFAGAPLSSDEISLMELSLRSALGADEDLEGFYRFASKDPILAETIQDLHGMRVGVPDDVFGRTILAILLQVTSMKRSDQMMTGLLHNYGNRIRFDRKEVILWPRPMDIAGVDPQVLREKANLGYRAKRLVRAAQFLQNQPLTLSELSALPEDDAIFRLMEIPGVGAYSAGIILGKASLPIDVWSVVILSELILGRHPENPREEVDSVVASLTERWGRWKWFAFVYILNDLDRLARTYRLSRIS
jgi:3-methyladenine DNA glycosylase/8-oxoguanine DNA glycosylase